MDLLKRITDKEICGTEGITQSTPRKCVRIVLLDDNNKVAILHLGKFDFYTVPGGGVDGCESLEQAAMREAIEETGCKCKIIHPIGIIEENGAHYDWVNESFCYIAQVKGSKGIPDMTSEEIEEETQVRWYDFHEALQIIKNQTINEQGRVGYIMRFVRERDKVMLNEAFYLLHIGVPEAKMEMYL